MFFSGVFLSNIAFPPCFRRLDLLACSTHPTTHHTCLQPNVIQYEPRQAMCLIGKPHAVLDHSSAHDSDRIAPSCTDYVKYPHSLLPCCCSLGTHERALQEQALQDHSGSPLQMGLNHASVTSSIVSLCPYTWKKSTSPKPDAPQTESKKPRMLRQTKGMIMTRTYPQWPVLPARSTLTNCLLLQLPPLPPLHYRHRLLRVMATVLGAPVGFKYKISPPITRHFRSLTLPVPL